MEGWKNYGKILSIGLEQRRAFLLEEAIPFGGSNSLSGSHSFGGVPSFYWKPFLLVETIPFSGSESFKLQPSICFKEILNLNIMYLNIC